MDLGAPKQLETIELRFPPSVSSSESLDYMKEVIDSAKQVLKASKATGGGGENRVDLYKIRG